MTPTNTPIEEKIEITRSELARLLRIDGKMVKPLDVIGTVSEDLLRAAVAYVAGKLDAAQPPQHHE